MKVKIILSALIICLTFALSTKAKEVNEKNKEAKQLPTYNFFNNANYKITGEKQDYLSVKFTLKISSVESENKVFTVDFMTNESFNLHFKHNINELKNSYPNFKVPHDTIVSKEANRLYYLFVAGIQTLEINDKGPLAGKLEFHKSFEITIMDDRLHPQVKGYLQELKKYKGKVEKNGVVLKKEDGGKEIQNKSKETKDKAPGKDKPVNINITDEKINIVGDSIPKQKIDSVSFKVEKIENPNNSNKATYVGWSILGRNPISLQRKFPFRKRHFLLPQEIEQNNITWLTKKEAEKSILDSKINEIDDQTKKLAFDTWKEYRIKKNEKENLDFKKLELDALIKKETFHIDSLKIVIKNKKESLNKIIIDSIFLFIDHSFIEGKLKSHFKDFKSETKNVDEKDYRTLLRIEIIKRMVKVYDNEKDYFSKVKIDSTNVLDSLNELELKLVSIEDSIKKSDADKRAYNNIKKDNIQDSIRIKKISLEQKRNEKTTLDKDKSELEWFNKNLDTIAVLLSESYSLKKDIERLNIENSVKELNLSKLKNENSITITNAQEKQNILDSLVKEYNKKLEELVKPNFKIEMAEIEFNNGFIENIRVKGKIIPIYLLENNDPNKDKILSPTLYFENLYPIGFSRESDYDYIYKTFLFANSNIKTVFNRNESVNYKLRLSDAITYDYKHEVNRRDYSPKNEIIKYDTTSIENPKVLHKLETAKLFELKVYSDFMGFNETSPNGLIQSELEKEIPILTRRYPSIYVWRSNWGFLSYVVPNLVISKIEDQNKHLPISYYPLTVGNTSIPIKYASTLDLFKYESFNTGIDINFFTYDILNAKSAIHINGGLKYGNTPIIDSTRSFSNEIVTKTGFATTDNINTFRVYPKVAIIIQPEERYSMTLSFTHNWYWARTNSFMQVGNTEKFQNSGEQQQKSNQFNTGELSANFNVNENNNNSGKLFFRYRFNWQQGYWNTGFSQIQFGYSFYLIRKL
jgi:hypothetical protein